MFTGIILGKGKVVEKRSSGSGMILSLESDFDLTDPEEGESIAVNGVCLTAKKRISAQEGLRLMFLQRVWTAQTWANCQWETRLTWKEHCA
jgi:riboflavin synthase alpha subunit